MSRPRSAGWRPAIGAWPAGGGTRFRVWSPQTRRVTLVLETAPGEVSRRRLEPAADGTFTAAWPDVHPGSRYRYRLDDRGPYPDPASRFQPDGVHGASLVVHPGRFEWTDTDWKGVALQDLVVYELHVGTFAPEGTFAGVTRRLPYLAELGVTAVELLPVSDFSGARNWGYDGVALFAPARCYGSPDDLRRLVDTAHALGLAVLLDVVYNHLGPDGAYASAFSPSYFSGAHDSPWGAGINFDGPGSAMVRELFIENALHWIHEYHVDGLRLDATHAIVDGGPRHFLAELSARVSTAIDGRSTLLIAEDHRNQRTPITPAAMGGWGLDAVWADDFHHHVRRLTAGDTDGYYRDFSGSTRDLASTLRQGWFFTGQTSRHLNGPRGSDPAGLPLERFVICIQNHDQVGNRARGERLHHQIAPAAYRAISTLLLCAPEPPLLFMGQEWAATTPFLYFTDHAAELGRSVTEGRRREFAQFDAFATPEAQARIPDPQARSTFLASRLRWDETHQEPHRAVLRLYRALLRLRRTESALRSSANGRFDVIATSEDAVAFVRGPARGAVVVGAIQLWGGGTVDLADQPALTLARPSRWTTLLSTEAPEFDAAPRPPEITATGGPPVIRFQRPGAVLLRADS